MMESSIKTTDSISYFEHNVQPLHQFWLREKNPADLQPFLQELKPNSRVLDLGCGTGIDLNYISKAKHEGVGIDASSKMIQMAKELNPAAQLINKNGLFLNLKEGEFDGVWANDFFNLFEPEQTQRMVATCFKGLKPGGVLGVIVREGVGNFEDREFDLNGPSRNIHLYTEKQICSMFEQTGFHIAKLGRQFGRMLVIAKRVS